MTDHDTPTEAAAGHAERERALSTGDFIDPREEYQPGPKCDCFPHGPDDPCTCSGCWACTGRVVGCTCDIAWDCEHRDP